MDAPELGRMRGELEAAAKGRLPKLVEVEDIKGDLHCHTTWSDGTRSMLEMAQAAKQRGLQVYRHHRPQPEPVDHQRA